MIGVMVYWSRLTEDGTEPTRSHKDDAGWDLTTSSAQTVEPGQLANISTSIAVALPIGWYGQLIGRSSTPRRYGLSVVEAVIDAGYRGELFIQVHNESSTPAIVPKGSRLAQLILLPVPAVVWVPTNSLPPSARGPNGFGSTGD